MLHCGERPAGTPRYAPLSGGVTGECPMNSIIYLVGLVVIVLAVLGFLGIG